MNQKSTKATWLGTGVWSLVALFIFIASLGCSWLTLKVVDFGFPLWYKMLKIETAIKTYAPRNQYRKRFEITSPHEHKRLFHEIVIAIHSDTSRLHQIQYHDQTGKPIDTLLREPEIRHLEDVAMLLRSFFLLCGILTAGAILLTLWLRQQALPFPGMKKILIFQTLFLLFSAAAVLLIGPTAVFYQLHVWVFPPEHQWFFYYYESLMTTLMLAPDVFGPIAITLVTLAIPYTLLGFWLMKTYGTAPQHPQYHSSPTH
ncbi:MAG: DUF1461 domain-containing protein [Gammaproteobacteria bacterium]